MRNSKSNWFAVFFFIDIGLRSNKEYFPIKNKDETEESAWKFSQKIMNRVSFESACMIKNIEQDSVKDDIKKGNKYRLLALYNMIGYGVTGFYPDLEKNKDKLNSKINEYIMCLREN